MMRSKAFLGVALLLLVAAAVEAVEDKKESEYCRNARKECEEKCKDMDMVGIFSRKLSL